MNEHPIESLMKTTMESIKEMVDVNTIVGDAVETPDGTVIIPISKVSFGFASGGGDYSMDIKEEDKEGKDNGENGGGSKGKSSGKFPFAGGAGAGVSVQPVAFMVVGNGQMKLMPVDQRANMIDNLINMTPSMINNIQKMFSGNVNGKQQKRHDEDRETITYE
ncbi:GerW family sporulation protein [Alkaliphilus peptidifermentans]|uniref:Sporulation protein YtfJ n=1 Tax=Alkaliphilus peptidifermentans DSM 18978 TaxID=1120976 RepID=A0A1G5KEV7_9FIRM|nr:GerW family sporulation protein [Alkaliphilus peptidifermentans]SCY99136.1 sporulation protein YtfJ [Alkaliphilus peptidifermentans DSM 18978]